MRYAHHCLEKIYCNIVASLARMHTHTLSLKGNTQIEALLLNNNTILTLHTH